MKKKIIITFKIIITMLMVAPVVLFALENACIGPIKAPRQQLVKQWQIDTKTNDGQLLFNFNINEDGTVDGSVGNAAILDAQLIRSRHWFSKILGHRRDYKIKGRLESSPTEKAREAFRLEFNLDRKGEMSNIKARLHD